MVWAVEFRRVLRVETTHGPGDVKLISFRERCGQGRDALVGRVSSFFGDVSSSGC